MNKVVLLLIIVVVSVVYTGCKKDEENSNQKPTCTITSPVKAQEITKGDEIIISVDASDKDGSIAEVRFFIDGVEKGLVTSVPFNYNWNTDSESIGNHVIKCTAVDNEGVSASDEISVVIKVNSMIPVANFKATPTTGKIPLSVNFTDQSTMYPIAWLWDFGDGGTSTLKNPTHTYVNEGNYIIKLTVTNNYGSGTETKPDYITVSGTSYSSFTDPRDQKIYKTITIGSQTWFAENLNYETPNSWSHDSVGSSDDIYGRLYSWGEALTVCPDGWHLPSDDEWKTLELNLGMSRYEVDNLQWRGTDEGKKMKSISGWKEDGNGTNTSGFNALPGGAAGSGGFFYIGSSGYWWTSESYTGGYAWYRSMEFNKDKVYRLINLTTSGSSVRCLKD